jgi:hypothetical protein
LRVWSVPGVDDHVHALECLAPGEVLVHESVPRVHPVWWGIEFRAQGSGLRAQD